MADVQAQFEKFNSTIRLGRFEENATLREKRDILQNRLREKLPDIFAAHGETCPGFCFADQGSYDMDTGIKPLSGEFDIDQGLYFKIGTDAYPDPVVLKERVYEALVGHTPDVSIRRSCVTVVYRKDGEPVYHVDTAVFSKGENNPDGKDRIARGKQSSADAYRVWQIANPQALTDCIWERFTGEDRQQFRRIVRSTKRWKDVRFCNAGNDRSGRAAGE